MKLWRKLLSFLAAGLLLFQGGILTGAEEPSLICPGRSYQEISVPDSITCYSKLTEENGDYQEILALEDEMVEMTNRLLGEELQRPIRIEDIHPENFYKLYMTQENIFNLTKTEDLLTLLSSEYAQWIGYIFLEEDTVSITLDQSSEVLGAPSHWEISSLQVILPEGVGGYDAAVQAGLDASSKEVSQALFVGNGAGMMTCLLCSDTIDTMVMVTQAEVHGDAAYLQRIAVPGTQPEAGVFDFRQVAANSESFYYLPPLQELELPEGTDRVIGGLPQVVPGIVQRQGPSVQTILLWCGVGAGAVVVCAAAVLIWRRRNKKKQS